MEKNVGFKRIVNVGVYSFNGLLAAIKNEAALRLALVFAAIFISVAMFIDVSAIERNTLIAVTLNAPNG